MIESQTSCRRNFRAIRACFERHGSPALHSDVDFLGLTAQDMTEAISRFPLGTCTPYVSTATTSVWMDTYAR
jgi:hypothetical protein